MRVKCSEFPSEDYEFTLLDGSKVLLPNLSLEELQNELGRAIDTVENAYRMLSIGRLDDALIARRILGRYIDGSDVQGEAPRGCHRP